jgi:hypothetical protein
MVASPIDLLTLWVASMASIEYNGRTTTRLCAAYGVAKTDINLSFALKFPTSASVAIDESLLVTENCICKFGRDTVKMVDKKMAKGQSTSKSNFLDTVVSEQSFYFPDKSGSCSHIFTPGGEISIISGSLNGGLSLIIAPISTLCQPSWKSTIMFQLASLSQTFR